MTMTLKAEGPAMAGLTREVGEGAPMGAFALSAPREVLRRLAGRLGRSGIARRGVSLLRRAVLFGRADPVDVEAFPGHWARLHPRDNLSEKRVFAGPQFWDAVEREALATAIRAHDPALGAFVMVDAGANAGLYGLAARAVDPSLRLLAIEPEPETARRLRFNLAAMPAGGPFTVVEVALAAESGVAHLAPVAGNRGEVRVADPSAVGSRSVPARPLAEIAATEGLNRIDALKIDIEGLEAPVLRAFFETAPTELHPRLVILEAPAREGDSAALALLLETGYILAARTRLNAILHRATDSDAPAAEPGPVRDGDHDGQA
ncbi:MAG: FkbM family methyltransferase [Pseudomonadota bacterium]